MPTDLEIIKHLEGEIRVELPRASIGGEIHVVGSEKPVAFGEFAYYLCRGYFVDDDTHVVGLALCELGLETVPRVVLSL